MIMKKRLSKKRRQILLNVLQKEWAFSALWDNVNQEGAEFKFVYGHTEEEAQEALKALIEALKTTTSFLSH